MANVWGVDYNDSLDDNKLRSSTGLAIDWFTPIGPLSLSISQPITKSNTDKTEKIRFNIDEDNDDKVQPVLHHPFNLQKKLN